jgi:hypothetical protein
MPVTSAISISTLSDSEYRDADTSWKGTFIDNVPPVESQCRTSHGCWGDVLQKVHFYSFGSNRVEDIMFKFLPRYCCFVFNLLVRLRIGVIFRFVSLFFELPKIPRIFRSLAIRSAFGVD